MSILETTKMMHEHHPACNINGAVRPEGRTGKNRIYFKDETNAKIMVFTLTDLINFKIRTLLVRKKSDLNGETTKKLLAS